MYHIIICDDDHVFVDYMKEMILNSVIEKNEIMIYEYFSGEELIAEIKKHRSCDLLILDMQMKKLDGHETAARFRKIFPNATLVFCSGICQPTDESFKTTPFRYLLKSYTDERMLLEMQAIIEEMRSKKTEPFIIGNYYYSTVRLRPDDILYIENAKHGSMIHVCKEKIDYPFEKNVSTKQKLRDLFTTLHAFGFEYAHNSYLVNLKYIIKMLSNGEVKLIDGTILTISRSRLKDFRKALSEELACKYLY